MILVIVLVIAGLAIGATAGVVVLNQQQQRAFDAAQLQAEETVRQAELQKSARLEETHTQAQESIANISAALEERRERIKEAEDRLAEKSDELSRRTQVASSLQGTLTGKENGIRATREDIAGMDAAKLQRLSEISGVSIEQAGAELLVQVERSLRDDAETNVREAESDLKERADEVSRRMLSDVMQRVNSPVVSTFSGSYVPLTESDHRKITTAPEVLEQLSALTGSVLTVKEDGSAVTISASDVVRRELARVSITEILKGGRNAQRDIERLVRKQEQRLDRAIRDEGIAATRRAGVGRLPDEVINTLGKLQFRYSYGQNQLTHAVETAHLAAMLAYEMGADVAIARAGGLLHDLGKAIDRDVEGTHAALGGALALEAGMDPRIAHCISAHHEEIDPETTEALITIVADAMSGARPGARRESLEGYLARLEAIEAVAHDFPGVEKCYAIQAGRELRVIVNPQVVDDIGSSRIAVAISERIQESLDYPGQIKVMVIREVKSVEQSR